MVDIFKKMGDSDKMSDDEMGNNNENEDTYDYQMAAFSIASCQAGFSTIFPVGNGIFVFSTPASASGTWQYLRISSMNVTLKNRRNASSIGKPAPLSLAYTLKLLSSVST